MNISTKWQTRPWLAWVRMIVSIIATSTTRDTPLALSEKAMQPSAVHCCLQLFISTIYNGSGKGSTRVCSHRYRSVSKSRTSPGNTNGSTCRCRRSGLRRSRGGRDFR
jgi:hypothetical protein